MIIDAHNHPDYHGYTVEKIIRDMDEQSIDKTWLLTWDVPQSEYNVRSNQNTMPPGSESGIPIDRILAAGAAAPDRFVLGYAPHPKRPDSIERINSAVSLYDIRLAGEYKSRTMFDDPDALRLLRRFGELGLPVTIHLEYGTDSGQSNYPWRDWWYGGTIGALDRMLAACPETIIVAHGPGWWSHISNDDLFDKEHYPQAPTRPEGGVPEMLDRYPNMYADLSAQSGVNALRRAETYGKQFLIDHQDKLLWARDLFDSRLMDHIDKLALPKSVFDKLTYLNAQKLIGES